jgi:SAM-dependent methyltransferase
LTTQEDINAQNAEFWNTLCGTGLAQSLGITDGSAASLKRFDDWYLDFYPYLLRHVPVHEMSGQKVLEIGLGYGTLSEQIGRAGATYAGLDIAQGPVDMVNSRMRMHSLAGEARQGNMLHCPHEDSSFDRVVSIGCFHHTGDTQRCFDETWRVLKPGGKAHLMVYNSLSYRQWIRFPSLTFTRFRRDLAGYSSYERIAGSEAQRKAYDADMEGRAAPETDFFSMKQLRSMLGKFSSVALTKENCDAIGFNFFRPVNLARNTLLTPLGRSAGLDIYVTAVK